MTEARLTKAQLNYTKAGTGSPRLTLSENGSWVTNGHWAVHLAVVKDRHRFASVEVMEALFPKATVNTIGDDSVERIIPTSERKWSVTEWMKVPNRSGNLNMRYLKAEDGEGWAVVDDRYLDMLGIEPADVLLGEDELHCFTTPDRTKVIMPMRAEGPTPEGSTF